ncbi:MAG: hypothetical protein PUA72_00210 [Lachnospiraceae bacterium]|nr:hypothetical protein [Lachnospiraceae bacterium]
MLKLLIKKQLLEIFQVYFYDAKKNKARSRTSTAMYFALFALLVFGLLGGIFTFLAVKLCTPLITAEMDWMYFALMGLIAVLLGAFGSVFNTYAGLYLPKDNDLLLSMPIPVSTLVGARLFGVYLMGLLYSAVVILPAIIVYWVTAGVTLPVVLGGLLMTLLISVFVLTISCVLGWLVAKISQKLKHKSLVTVLISLVVIGVYYFVYFKAQSLIQNLLANAAVYGARIKGAAYPVYLFGKIGVGDVRASVSGSVVVVALFGLMWVLLSRSFLQIAISTGNVIHREYRETRSRQRSMDAALLNREFSHFTASPNYMLNCGLGTFLMPLCAVAVLWKGSELFAVLDAMFAETAGSVLLLLCVMLCGLASMNFMTAPSVSLEGKNLWLMQSLPVETWRIFRAKIRMQLLLTGLPLLLCIVCVVIVYPIHSMQLLILLLFAGSYVLLMALLGLFLGVKMPTLTWTNETVVIKQGAPVMITLFGGFGYMVLLFVGFMLLSGWMLGFCGYMSCFVGANLFLSGWFYLWLRKKGVARFSAL